MNHSSATTLVISVPKCFTINCDDVVIIWKMADMYSVNKALVKYCRTDAGYNFGYNIVNRDNKNLLSQLF
ncbi:hypothetical protein AW111_17725 [Escherichia coli]|nr:hypothetical protein SS17_2792 [Escherichia coli O157:H7 str. SS17]AJA26764.1 hypothetical protein SS52_2910 [Escherichia coli O157:H7 str. SS52]APT61994.1 hypothetical protein BUE82_08445 [Escherichia coli]EIP28605.1 hypothetical protein ECEC4013_3190 [Escherichia coli EC4013]EKJ10753.1 hypothetical protein ECEC1864_3106 [Escherichia coli EC1864]EKK28794.1 hypothetical protein EC34870_3123 [Escherichia coli 3.4870]ERB75866.1 hypothetical protein EC09BKT76207_2600 [Escherichia coli 09BKT07